MYWLRELKVPAKKIAAPLKAVLFAKVTLKIRVWFEDKFNTPMLLIEGKMLEKLIDKK